MPQEYIWIRDPNYMKRSLPHGWERIASCYRKTKVARETTKSWHLIDGLVVNKKTLLATAMNYGTRKAFLSQADVDHEIWIDVNANMIADFIRNHKDYDELRVVADILCIKTHEKPEGLKEE